MSGPGDVWLTVKTLTLLEASYLCSGKPPVTDDERRLTKTAHPADVMSMARRLVVEVSHDKLFNEWRGRRMVRERIFKSTAVWDFAKLNDFRLPWEPAAARAAPPAEPLLRQIGLLSLLLAEKSGKYRLGEKPNARAIAVAVGDILDALPDVHKRGLSGTTIRQSISAGLRLLANDDDDQTGQSQRYP